MKFLKENKLQIFIVLFIAFLTWHKVLSTIPTGEGYMYFSKALNLNPKYISPRSILATYDFFAQFAFTILIPIFRDNISYYMYFQFVVMLITYLTFYYVSIKIFKDKIQSTLSTLFFITNYVGQFTMMGQGDYQRFIQRVPNIIPTLLAFLCLIYFLRTGKLKYFIYSLVGYTFSMILSHFTAFFLPLFIFLPPIYAILTKKISLKKALLAALIFGVVTLAITRTDPLARPNHSVLDFAFHTPRIVEMVTYQVSQTGFPIPFTQFLAEHAKPALARPYTKIMTPILIIIIIFLYLAGLKVKKDKENLSIYLTVIISLFVTSFLLLYAYDAFPNPLVIFGEDRMYFIHSILFAILWGIIIKGFFHFKKTYVITGVLIAILFLIQNVPLTLKEMDRIEVHSRILNVFLKEMKNKSTQFNKNTVIIANWELLDTQNLLSRFYNIADNHYITLEDTAKTKLAQITDDRNSVFVYDVKYTNGEDGVPDPNTVTIIDYTQYFRSTGKLDMIKK